MLSCAVSACSNVQVLRLTSQQFSPRPINDVQILEKEPTTEHLRLAELVASSSTSSLDDLQRDIVKKAAKLGASAVVFSRPTVHTEQRVSYSGNYSPWGYYAPYYYGPWPRGYFGFGYGAWPSASYGSMYGPWGAGWGYWDVPYVVQVQTLKGVAIRYIGS
ncbi:hypothetical protein [Nitrospira sp. Nam74]